MEKQKNKKIKVSYSQFSTYLKCPKKWYYDYALNLRKFEGNINTAFGTSIHETLQNYLKVLYEEGVSKADDINCTEFFKNAYDTEIVKLNDNGIEISENDYNDYYFQGEDIISEFLKTSNRLRYFPTTYEFLGLELKLNTDIMNNLEFIGYVDVVLKEKNKNKYRIIDIKTSYSGWNSYMKEDLTKTMQLSLYKAFYSKIFNVPLSAIDVEFFIVKRNLYENVKFPQSRIQVFKPDSKKAVIVDTMNCLVEFIEYAFHKDGTFNVENEYEKVPGKAKKHCKYCLHYKNKCDGKKTK